MSENPRKLQSAVYSFLRSKGIPCEMHQQGDSFTITIEEGNEEYAKKAIKELDKLKEGKMKTPRRIELHPQDLDNNEDESAEGFTTQTVTSDSYTWEEVLLPEFGAERFYPNAFPMVMKIGEKMWLVEMPDYDWENPPDWYQACSLVFTECDEPEDDGDIRAEVEAFGQPYSCQKQGEMHPAYNGKAMSCLFTIHSGWGDAGTENYFLALDENGDPAHLVYESSCH